MVCPYQSVAKIDCDFRWRSNSPRSAYKIARCVAGFSEVYVCNIQNSSPQVFVVKTKATAWDIKEPMEE